MKAIRVKEFGAPEVMKLEEVPDLKPGAGQVLVKLAAVGVNPVDAYMRSGNYPRKPSLPYTPGMDGAGTVEAVGEGVQKLKVGDRVYVAGSLTGTYAEQALCQETQVYALSSKASFAQGAALGVPYATAYRALFQRAQAQPGERVLIHGGSGGVGTAAIQLAHAAGMVVLATAGSDKGKKLLQNLGVEKVFDHQSQDYADQILAACGGKGVDVILEMRADLNLGKDFKLLGSNGRVVVIGSRGTATVDGRDLMSREAAVMGMTLFNASAKDLFHIHAALAQGLENGTLKPVIGQELDLKDASQAHELILKPGSYGKLVLKP